MRRPKRKRTLFTGSMGNDISCAEIEDASCCTRREAEVGRMKVLHSSSNSISSSSRGRHSSAHERDPLPARQHFAEAAVFADRSASDIYRTAIRHEEMQLLREPRHFQMFAATPAHAAATSRWTDAGPASAATHLRDPGTEQPQSTSSGRASSTMLSGGGVSKVLPSTNGPDEDELIEKGEERDSPQKEEYVKTILLLRRELGKARRQAQKSNERFIQHFLEQTASPQ